jgi:hypothetical protein
MNVTVLAQTAIYTPWWGWLYVLAIGLMCALAFAASTFYKDKF